MPGVEVCLHCQGVWVGADALAAAHLAEPASDEAKRVAEVVGAVEAGAYVSLDPDERLSGIAMDSALDDILYTLFGWRPLG